MENYNTFTAKKISLSAPYGIREATEKIGSSKAEAYIPTEM